MRAGRTGRIVALALLAIVGAGVVVLAVRAIADDSTNDEKPSGSLAATLQAAKPASTPFEGLTETHLLVGDECLRTVIADSEPERVEGLRQRSDIGPYDAMLFVFDGPVDVGFTMSTVPVPLEIGFYSADGTRTSSQHMLPCPKAENECPIYRASQPFEFALETLNQKLPSGNLAGCSPT